MDKHTEVHNLGTLAAKSDLMAASLPDYYRPALEDHSKRLRDAQFEYMGQGRGKCVTEGCDTMTPNVRCGQCSEEMAGTPCPLPAWAVGIWLGAALGAIYTVALIGQGIDWTPLHKFLQWV